MHLDSNYQEKTVQSPEFVLISEHLFLGKLHSSADILMLVAFTLAFQTTFWTFIQQIKLQFNPRKSANLHLCVLSRFQGPLL